MTKKQTRKATSSKPAIFEVARQVHHTVARYCDCCGAAMTPSDVNDYGSLCERCYTKEYYND